MAVTGSTRGAVALPITFVALTSFALGFGLAAKLAGDRLQLEGDKDEADTKNDRPDSDQGENGERARRRLPARDFLGLIEGHLARSPWDTRS